MPEVRKKKKIKSTIKFIMQVQRVQDPGMHLMDPDPRSLRSTLCARAAAWGGLAGGSPPSLLDHTARGVAQARGWVALPGIPLRP